MINKVFGINGDDNKDPVEEVLGYRVFHEVTGSIEKTKFSSNYEEESFSGEEDQEDDLDENDDF